MLIPSQTHIGTNPWAIHYNQNAFGLDAHEFKPGRWEKRRREQSGTRLASVLWGLDPYADLNVSSSILLRFRERSTQMSWPRYGTAVLSFVIIALTI